MPRISLKVRRRVIGAFGLLVVAGAAATVHGEDYKIKLTRPDKIGVQYTTTITAKMSQSVTVTVNGQEKTDNDKFTTVSHGTLKVLAINEKTGEATKLRYQVDSLTKDGKEFYPEGTVIIVAKSGQETTFDIDGDRPDPDHFKVLNTLFDVSSPDEKYNEDELYGTDKSQKVGDTWSINTEANAKDLADADIPVAVENLKGDSTLREVKQDNGTEVMVVSVTISADKLKKENAEGGSVTDGKLNAEITETVPTDPTKTTTALTEKMSLEMTSSIPNGGTSKFKMKMEKKQEFEPVKP